MNIYIQQKYCVYMTQYRGSLFPNNYIGSSTIKRIEEGYRGSVKSKKYKNLWEQELKENPHLFETYIISIHHTKQEAAQKELKLQKIFNAVKNPLFVNCSFAKPFGFFGMDVSGENNPNFGNHPKVSIKTREKKKEIHKKDPRIWLISPEGICEFIKISEKEKYLNSGWFKGRTFKRKKPTSEKTPKCSCYICKKEIHSHCINNHYKWSH